MVTMMTTTTQEVKDDDLLITSFFSGRLSKMIEKDELKQFIRVYLLDKGDQSIRRLTHLFFWHFYSDSSSSRSVHS
jgi:hypothetical protein